MEVIFLGTGTSQGVPMIAQPDLPGACDLNNPKNWRTRASIHVVMDGLHIQVDAGPEFRMQCIREDIQQIDLFVLTHSHADHILGMDDMRRFCDLRGFGAMPVFGDSLSLERIRSIFPYAIRDRPVVKGYPAFHLKEMPARLELDAGTITSTILPHGSMDVLGLVFEEKSTGQRLAYFTDCADVPEAAMTIAAKSDVVILDGLRPEPHPTHMHIDRAIAVAQTLNARQAYLTHLTFMVDYELLSPQLPDRIALAYDGLRLDVGNPPAFQPAGP